MQTNGILTLGVRFAVFLRMSPKRGANAAEACLKAPRPRSVTRADLRRYGVTVGCAACSDIAAHGKAAKPSTDECRARIGEEMDQLQRRRGVEHEVPLWLKMRTLPHNWSNKSLRCLRQRLVSPRRWNRRQGTCSLEAQVRGQARPETRHVRHIGTQDQDQGEAGTQEGTEAQPFWDFEEEVENTGLTVPVLGGSVPIEGGSSSSEDILVFPSMSVEDMVQKSVPISTNVGIQLSSSGTAGSLCASMNTRPEASNN